MSVTLGTIALPSDVAWTDEYQWLPTAAQVEVTTGGSLIIEESKQLAGRPITLESGQDRDGRYWAIINRATANLLYALAADVLDEPLELVLEDGRTFDVRFRHADGAFEAQPLVHIAPHVDGDKYSFTLRLMQV